MTWLFHFFFGHPPSLSSFCTCQRRIPLAERCKPFVRGEKIRFKD